MARYIGMLMLALCFQVGCAASSPAQSVKGQARSIAILEWLKGTWDLTVSIQINSRPPLCITLIRYGRGRWHI